MKESFHLVKTDKSFIDRVKSSFIELGIISAFFFFAIYSDTYRDIPMTSFYSCPVKDWTGYSCMGCGLTRGTIFFCHFDFIQAIMYNPFVIVIVPGVALRLYQKLSFIFFKKYLAINIKVRTVFVFLFLFFLFGITRALLEIFGVITPI